MEEMPTMAVPDTEAEQNFIIPQARENAPVTEKRVLAAQPQLPAEATNEDNEEFDLSDITANPSEKSREDIIAEAEAAAFAEPA